MHYAQEHSIIKRLVNVHDSAVCAHRACTIHNPTHHHMRKNYLHWRGDRKIFERICPHGTGHPDPDQYPYWEETGQMVEAVHGCDGCCMEVNTINPEFNTNQAQEGDSE